MIFPPFRRPTRHPVGGLKILPYRNLSGKLTIRQPASPHRLIRPQNARHIQTVQWEGRTKRKGGVLQKWHALKNRPGKKKAGDVSGGSLLALGFLLVLIILVAGSIGIYQYFKISSSLPECFGIAGERGKI